MKCVLRDSLRLFALALGLAEDFFASRAQKAPLWPVTIAHYPPQKVAPAEDKERIQAHWDRTLFSLITTSGLKRQVKLVGNRVFHLVKCHSIFYFIQS